MNVSAIGNFFATPQQKPEVQKTAPETAGILAFGGQETAGSLASGGFCAYA